MHTVARGATLVVMDTTTLTAPQVEALRRLAATSDDGYGCAGHPKPARGLSTQVHTGTAKSLVRKGLAEVSHIRTRHDRTSVTYYVATPAGRDMLAEVV